jgi:Ricin-type beta-trefoil lectin domain-like
MGAFSFPQKTTGTDNQLWEFVADPAGSGYYYIKSKLDGNVIDIQRASTSVGAGLDAFPQKISGTDNQLWAVVGGSFPSTVRRCRRRLLDCSVIPTTTSTAA